jgi:hypothetical protein
VSARKDAPNIVELTTREQRDDRRREQRTIEMRCAHLADAILDLCGYGAEVDPLSGHKAMPDGMMVAAVRLAAMAFNDRFGTTLRT